MPTTAEVRTVAVGGQRLRVAITSGPNGPGREPRIPLLLINGIGASLEALDPGGAEEVDRQRYLRRLRDHLGPLAGGRPGQGVRGGAGHTRLRDLQAEGQDRA